jgi:membrane protein implicated in regulation of membrane protease activity
MMQNLNSLTSIEQFYLACAVLGGVLFVVRTVLMLIGHTGDFAADLHTGDMHGDADASFKFLSLQSLTAFFMMFGLVALTLSRQTKVSEVWAIVGGLAAGALTIWIINRIFIGMKSLQSDGTLKIENAIGQEGSVYLNIPAGKSGQVRVAAQGQLRIFDAVSDSKEQISTGDRIRVKGVSSGNVLVVEKI